MAEIVLASNNKKKIAELETLLTSSASNGVKILSLKDIGYTDDIIEDGDTYEENSIIKASVPASRGYIGIADDSGLSVDILDGAPGVYSARYSGEGANDESNRKKLLCNLEGVPAEQRSAKFVCTAAVVFPKDSKYIVPEEWRIPEWLREKYRDRCIRIPMRAEARSLNLGNSAAIVCYEALKQQNFPGLLSTGIMADN